MHETAESFSVWLQVSLRAYQACCDSGVDPALFGRLMEETDAGLETLRQLLPGLLAVRGRLEYGATKHPEDGWKGQTDRDHMAALLRHAAVLREDDYDLPLPERRKHLAAVACRALMALTIDAITDVDGKPEPSDYILGYRP